MKQMLMALMLMTSTQLLAAPMGAEAVEIFELLNHFQVKKCLASLDRKLVNVSIDKMVYRCPGCNSYTITGKFLEIDVPRPEKVRVTLRGKAMLDNANQWRQTYDCEIAIK
jgi:hypothetical protein